MYVFAAFFVGMINSGIHALMYAYYALAALGPSMQKYLWWKKHMTTLQLVRTLFSSVHNKFRHISFLQVYLVKSSDQNSA
jgi:GNS1/SUR4 family